MSSPAALQGTKPKITEEGLIKAAYSCGGIIRLVAEKFGVSRNAIYKRVQQSKALQTAFDQASESLLDLAEAKHIEAIKAGYYPAIQFHLKTKGRKRGYSMTDPITTDENGGFILRVTEAFKKPEPPQISSKENAERNLSELMEIFERASQENPPKQPVS